MPLGHFFHDLAVQVGGLVFRIDRDRAIKFGERLGLSSEVSEAEAHVTVARRVLRIERGGSPEAFECATPIAPFHQIERFTEPVACAEIGFHAYPLGSPDV